MRILLIAISIFALTSTSVFAKTVCRVDWKGDTVCTSGKVSDGSRTQHTIKKDWKGDTVIRNDRSGRTTTCKYDWKNDYVCQ